MTILLTGATGFLGAYITELLLQSLDNKLALLVRAQNQEEAEEKLWRALQLHMTAEQFWDGMRRIEIFFGDLTEPRLGLDDEQWTKLVTSVDSIIHTAATLNRKSAKACFNTNLRGTLSMIKLAQAIARTNGLRRFSFVSTSGVAGVRNRELVTEDNCVDWTRSDYDPYGRTKKFCEHMVRELLDDVPFTIFRPTTVIGDSRFVETTQFDMVRAFCTLADMPAVPVRRDARLDIVNADFVATAIVKLHQRANPRYDCYHLSAGLGSKTAEEIAQALLAKTKVKTPRFLPSLEGPLAIGLDALASLRTRNSVTRIGSLLKVFLPYITYDTVFDNSRVTEELGIKPVPFTDYCGELYLYAKENRFEYSYKSLPRVHVG